MKRTRSRTWPWHAGTALLALVFAQPACFTMNTWADDRSRQTLHEAEPPHARAHRVSGDEGAIAFELPAERAVHLHGVCPEIPATACWIVIEPLEHRQTAATLLAIACAKGLSYGATPYAPVDVGLVDDSSSGTITWRLRWRHSSGRSLPDVIPRLPGFSKRAALYTWYRFDVPCKVIVSSTEPMGLAEPIPAFSFTHELVRDDGTPVVTRLLVTPFAVLGDLLLSPFELLWWLSP